VKFRFETKIKYPFKELQEKCFEQEKMKHKAKTYGFYNLFQWQLGKK